MHELEEWHNFLHSRLLWRRQFSHGRPREECLVCRSSLPSTLVESQSRDNFISKKKSHILKEVIFSKKKRVTSAQNSHSRVDANTQYDSEREWDWVHQKRKEGKGICSRLCFFLRTRVRTLSCTREENTDEVIAIIRYPRDWHEDWKRADKRENQWRQECLATLFVEKQCAVILVQSRILLPSFCVFFKYFIIQSFCHRNWLIIFFHCTLLYPALFHSKKSDLSEEFISLSVPIFFLLPQAFFTQS